MRRRSTNGWAFWKRRMDRRAPEKLDSGRSLRFVLLSTASSSSSLLLMTRLTYHNPLKLLVAWRGLLHCGMLCQRTSAPSLTVFRDIFLHLSFPPISCIARWVTCRFGHHNRFLLTNFGDRAISAAVAWVCNFLLTDHRQPDLSCRGFRQWLKMF